jgi:hypothetical protein
MRPGQGRLWCRPSLGSKRIEFVLGFVDFGGVGMSERGTGGGVINAVAVGHAHGNATVRPFASY